MHETLRTSRARCGTNPTDNLTRAERVTISSHSRPLLVSAPRLRLYRVIPACDHREKRPMFVIHYVHAALRHAWPSYAATASGATAGPHRESFWSGARAMASRRAWGPLPRTGCTTSRTKRPREP